MTKVRCEYTELVEIHKLIPNPKNPNKHPQEQIERLAKIIDYQGMRSPIVVSKLSGFITKGHGRLEALKLLGWDSVPVDYQDYDTEAQEFSDMVADNALAEWSTQDFSMINLELPDHGPELDIEMLGLKDFVIEPADKLGEEVTDPLAEYEGPDMGDNTNRTEKAHGKVIVWFETENNHEQFQELIGKKFTLGKNTTNSIWFPS